MKRLGMFLASAVALVGLAGTAPAYADIPVSDPGTVGPQLCTQSTPPLIACPVNSVRSFDSFAGPYADTPDYPQSMYSANGYYHLYVDGNCHLKFTIRNNSDHGPNETQVWTIPNNSVNYCVTDDLGYSLKGKGVLGLDGQFVLYRHDQNPGTNASANTGIWSTGTAACVAAAPGPFYPNTMKFVVQNDGNVVLYARNTSTNSAAVWSSNSGRTGVCANS